MPIQLLSPDVIDQIAAGEVVERPAHLVKELVENSVDAGATEVDVEFDHGGRRVRVTDNGGGIPSAELPLALSRHATSKIRKTLDLWSLNTFGFRGEALASIAAVSRLKLISRPQGADQAQMLSSEFGHRSPVEGCGGEVGTSIRVEDLFANVPARLKFLKSDVAEAGQIKNVLKAMALSNPSVAFRVRHKGKLLFYWPACKTKKERVLQVLGVSEMYEGESERQGVHARVVVSSPKDTVKTSRSIWLFAQGRWVQDKAMQAAVMEAYRGLLMHGEYPVAAVWVECDSENIDVNMHPTKSQVKFRDSSSAFRAVQSAIRQVLESAPWIGEMEAQQGRQVVVPASSMRDSELTPPSAPEVTQKFDSPEMERLQYAKKSFPQPGGVMDSLQTYAPAPTSQSQEVWVDTAMSSPASEQSTQGGAFKAERAMKAEDPSNADCLSECQASSSPRSIGIEGPPETSTQVSVSDRAGGSEGPQRENISTSEVESQGPTTAGFWSRLQVIGQAHLTYILAQSDKALFIVDQHASHERIAYERLMQAWKSGEIEVQHHLLPLTVEMGEDLVEALMTQTQELAKLGLEFDQVDPTTVGVRAAPSILRAKSLEVALQKVAEDCLEQGESFSFEKVVSELCSTMACHSVVRAGKAMSMEEMQQLLQQMDEFPLSSFCPHGRPVYIEYSLNRLEKDFGRIV